MIRKTSSVIVCSMLLMSIFIGVVNFVPSAKAESGAPYDTGSGYWQTDSDWQIQPGDDITHENKTIIVNGNLIVNGTLTLINVTLKMGSSTYDGETNISVLENGNLTITDYDDDYNTVSDGSVIMSNNSFSFGIQAWTGSSLELKNSEIRDCGWDNAFVDTMGIFVYTDWANITGNYIHDSMTAVCIYDVDNVTVANNTMSNLEGFGVYTHFAEDCYLINNTVTSTGSHGFMIYSSYFLNMSYNDISASVATHGILARGGGGHEIYNNTVSNNDIGIFLYADASSESTIILYINENDISNNDYGVYLRGFNGGGAIQYIYIYDNDIYSNNNDGIFISGEDATSAVRDIEIYDNKIYSNGWNGIYIQGDTGPYAVNNVYIYDNEIYSNGATQQRHGIYLNSVNWLGDVGYIYCFDNLVRDNRASGSLRFGYYIDYASYVWILRDNISYNDRNLRIESADHIYVENCTFIRNPGIGDEEIRITNQWSNPPSVYFLNTTFNKNYAYVSDTGSFLQVDWYMHIRVVQEGLGVDDATVWVNDSSSNPDPPSGQPFTTGTGNDGWIKWLIVKGFNRTSTSTTYYTPHQIEAVNGTAKGLSAPDMDMSKEVIVILDTVPNTDSINAVASSVYRTNTVYITANGSDYEDTEDLLTPHIEYKEPGSLLWVDTYIGAPAYNALEFWEIPFNPPAGALTGNYLFRGRFNDTFGHYSNWLDSMDIVTVLNNPPTADAGPDGTASAGIPYVFDDSGSADIEDPGSLSYAWDIDNSDGVNWTPANYTVSSPSHVYILPGVYVATLNVTDLDGDWDLDTVTITVVDSTPPVADAGQDAIVKVDTSHDFNGSLSYDNVGIVWYNWSFGDGQYDNGTNITTNHTYTAEGIYIVTLNCSDAVGLWSTDTVTITVNPSDPPIAKAGPDNSTNEGSPIIFNGSLSTDDFGIVNFTWDIDESDGLDFSNPTFWGEEITHTYNIPGTYIVTLNVTDEHGGWDLDNLTVIVIDITPPNAVAIIPTPIDEDTSYMFDASGSSDNSGSIAYYNWTWGDGNFTFGTDPQPWHSYAEPDFYLVTLNVSDPTGLWDTYTELIEVKDITLPNADAGPPNSTNEDAPINFDASASSDNVGIVNYYWDMDASDGLDWVTPDQTGVKPSHVYNTPGFYTVTLNCTDSEGNWGLDTTTIDVFDITPPTANAGLDDTWDEDSPYMFDASGSFDNVGITNYAWDIDASDGVDWGSPDYSGSNLWNPAHTYTQPGIYTVTLNVTDAVGYWDIDQVQITVNDITTPIADAGLDDSVDNGTAYGFDGSGSWDNVDIVNYAWDIDASDGVDWDSPDYEGPALWDPTHTYNQPGDYTVTLNVTDAAGNSDTDTVKIDVIDIMNPVANAGPDDIVDENIQYIFDASNSYDDAGITEYAWDMDASDGVDWANPDYSGPTLWDPMHTYTVPGTYLVSLNVTDADGNWDTDTVYITVRDITSPIADVGPDDTTDEDTIYSFDGTGSSDNSGSIAFYNWSFGDDEYALGIDPQPSHIYVEPGDYLVILNVTDAAGNWDTDTMILTVLDITPPFVSAGPDDTVNEDIPYMFDASASYDNVGIDNYTWDIDDSDGVDWGSPDYSGAGISTPVHTYSQPGTYTVTLNVTDAAGNSATDILVITVEDVTSPTPNAGPDDTVNEDIPYNFDASGSSDNVGIVSYAWDLDASDGLDWQNPDSTEIAPTHIYSQPGVYTVTLNVSDAVGNWATDTLAITVVDITLPTANAGTDDEVNEDTPYNLNASGSQDNVGITSYAWDIDASDGIDWSSPDYTEESPTHIYIEPGVYTVTLNVTDSQGNWAIDSVVIEVYDVTPPILSVVFTDTVDEDWEHEFDASGSSDDCGIAAYNFTFGDGFYISGTEAIVTHTYVDPGTYILTVNVTDSAGNWNTSSWLVTVRDITHPLTPAGLTVSKVPAGSALNISWNLNTEGDINYYELDYSDDGQNFELVDNISQGISYYMHTGLINGKNYWYYLVAVDDAGLSSEPSPLILGNPDRDLDDDGTYDTVDEDDDGDGWNDITDEFPNDPSEWADNDEDGTGDNADDDDDNDDVLDVDDAFPFDSSETLDFDGDGIGNNADNDDDNDGVPDGEDDFPLDPKRSKVDFDFMSILFILIAIIAIVVAAILGGALSRQKRRNNTLSMKLTQFEQAQTRQPQVPPPAAQPITKPKPPPPPVSQPITPKQPPAKPPIKAEETLQQKVEEATPQAVPPVVPIIPALAPEKPEEQLEPLEEEPKPTEEPAPGTAEAEEKPQAEEPTPETIEPEEKPQVEEPAPETTELKEQPQVESPPPQEPTSEAPEEVAAFELVEEEEKPAEPEKKAPPRPPKGRKPPRPPKKMLKKSEEK